MLSDCIQSLLSFLFLSEKEEKVSIGTMSIDVQPLSLISLNVERARMVQTG